MPLEWFPHFWDDINRSVAERMWVNARDYPLGERALAYEWPTQGGYVHTPRNVEEERVRTAGTFFSDATGLMSAVREASRTRY